MKLPEAPLPTFDGKYENWLTFKNAFTNMIGSRTDLSDVDKLLLEVGINRRRRQQDKDSRDRRNELFAGMGTSRARIRSKANLDNPSSTRNFEFNRIE